MEILTTERLTFHTWTQSDLEDAMALWGDPKVMALLDKRGGLKKSQVEERLAVEMDRQEKLGMSYWRVVNRLDGTFVGCCGIRPYDRRELGIEIGFHVVSAQWGKGYATEAARRVIAYAFDTLGLPKLFAGHHPQNGASRAVLIKLGFQYIGDNLYEPTGLYHPDYQRGRVLPRPPWRVPLGIWGSGCSAQDRGFLYRSSRSRTPTRRGRRGGSDPLRACRNTEYRQRDRRTHGHEPREAINVSVASCYPELASVNVAPC